MATLFEIGDDLKAMLNMIQDDGEIDTALSEWMDRLAEQEAEKLDAYVGLIRILEGEEAVAKAEAEQYTLKAKARANKVKQLKERIKDHLIDTQRDKVTTATGRVLKIQANGGAATVEIDPIPLKDVPFEFVKVVREIDREAVREALSKGEELTFARMLKKGCHIRIA
jgi:hypothetical protein